MYNFRKKLFTLAFLMAIFFLLLDLLGLNKVMSYALAMIHDQDLALLVQRSFSGMFYLKLFFSIFGILSSIMYVKWMIQPYHNLAKKVLRHAGIPLQSRDGYEATLRKALSALDKQKKAP